MVWAEEHDGSMRSKGPSGSVFRGRSFPGFEPDLSVAPSMMSKPDRPP